MNPNGERDPGAERRGDQSRPGTGDQGVERWRERNAKNRLIDEGGLEAKRSRRSRDPGVETWREGKTQLAEEESLRRVIQPNKNLKADMILHLLHPLLLLLLLLKVDE